MFDFGGVLGRLLLRLRAHGRLRRAAARATSASTGSCSRRRRRAAPRRVPGALASEVNAACRAPIEDAGLGEFFRHRMGHGIGLDVHEQPFISIENDTPLEPGMTFTDEPSILWDGHFAVRIEDIVVCAEGGGEFLNALPREAVVNRS